MKLTNADVFFSKEALEHLTNRDDIPLKYAMPIVRMAKKLNEEFILVEDKRNRLVVKYGKSEGNIVNIAPEDPNWSKFVAEYNELMSLDTEVLIEKAKIPANIIVPTKDLMFLEPFLEVVE